MNTVIYDRTKVPAAKTTYQAVRKRCVDCMGGERFRIKDCPISDCLLWPHRFGTTPTKAKSHGHNVGNNMERLTMKGLRAECAYCMGGGKGAAKDIRECTDIDCGLHPFRFGRRDV